MDTHTVTVRVAGKNYSLTSTDTAEHVQRFAALADRRLAELTALHPSLDRDSLPIAVILSLADELVKAQDDNARLRKQLCLPHAGP